MLFKDIPGQNQVKDKLIRTVNEERISHAQLFTGPEGCGKLALAIAYAQYICCETRSDIDSCGTCHSCIKYNKLVHPDLHFAYPAGTPQKKENDEDAGADISLHDKWRQALIENPYMDQFQWYERIGIDNKQGLIGTKDSSEIIRKIMLKPYESEYKVLIMWLPERMNAFSANKLLKIIEEPPPFTLFLLVSEMPGEILPTIISRTQIVKIQKLRDDDIREGLSIRSDISAGIMDDAVKLADGNLNRAIAFVQPDDANMISFGRFVALMRACYGKSISDIMNWVEEISSLGREKQKLFLSYGMRMLRENFLMNTGNPEILHMAGYENEWSEKFSKFIDKQNIFGLYKEFNNAFNHIAANGYARIILLDMGLNIVKLFRK